MTHIYDRSKTFNYFESLAVTYDSYADETNLHARDRLLLEKVLPGVGNAKLRILDYGCGGGHLLAALFKRGHEVFGIEPGEALQTMANEKLANLGRQGAVQLGGLELLPKIESDSLDMFVAMGVFQYLSDEELAETLAQVVRILKPNGHLVSTFQNSLFDLFTFNKYTVDFFEHKIFPALAPLGLKVPQAVAELKTLLANPDLPSHNPSRARDTIFVRLSNPLTIADELQQSKLKLEERYFYAFHAVPPIIAKQVGPEAQRVAEELEVEHSQEWHGYFTGSAFLTHCRPLK